MQHAGLQLSATRRQHRSRRARLVSLSTCQRLHSWPCCSTPEAGPTCLCQHAHYVCPGPLKPCIRTHPPDWIRHPVCGMCGSLLPATLLYPATTVQSRSPQFHSLPATPPHSHSSQFSPFVCYAPALQIVAFLEKLGELRSMTPLHPSTTRRWAAGTLLKLCVITVRNLGKVGRKKFYLFLEKNTWGRLAHAATCSMWCQT